MLFFLFTLTAGPPEFSKLGAYTTSNRPQRAHGKLSHLPAPFPQPKIAEAIDTDHLRLYLTHQ